jgi:hypothetical protein
VQQRIGAVLVLAILLAAILVPAMNMAQAFSIDYHHGGVVLTDPRFIAVAIVISLAIAGGAWVADVRKTQVPLLILPLGVFVALAIGYQSTAFAFENASSRYAILTDDCYYPDAPVYHALGGIIVLWDGKTAFHPSEKVRSMRPVEGAS